MAIQIRTNAKTELARLLRSVMPVLKEDPRARAVAWISPKYTDGVKAMFALYNEAKRRNPEKAVLNIDRLWVKADIFGRVVTIYFFPAAQPDRMRGLWFDAVFIDEDVIISPALAQMAADRTKEPPE